MVPDDPERKMDGWLDEALARYSDTEPLPGLEGRVMDRLAAEKRGLPHRWRKAWAPALAAAAAVILVTLVVVRNRSLSLETVSTKDRPAQNPAALSVAKVQELAPEMTEHGGGGEAEESRPQGPTGSAPSPGRGPDAPRAAGKPQAKGSPGIHHGVRSASRVTSHPRNGTVFPAPAPLSEQERLALAAMQSGLLSSPRPEIPPGDEPLPRVSIQEIEIRPLQEIKPIGMEEDL